MIEIKIPSLKEESEISKIIVSRIYKKLGAKIKKKDFLFEFQVFYKNKNPDEYQFKYKCVSVCKGFLNKIYVKVGDIVSFNQIIVAIDEEDFDKKHRSIYDDWQSSVTKQNTTI